MSGTYRLRHSWMVVVSATRVLFILLERSSARGVAIPFQNLQFAEFQRKHGNPRQRTRGCHIHPCHMSEIRISCHLNSHLHSRIGFRPQHYRGYGTGLEIQLRHTDRSVTDADPGNYRPYWIENSYMNDCLLDCPHHSAERERLLPNAGGCTRYYVGIVGRRWIVAG